MKVAIAILLIIAGTACAAQDGDFTKMGALGNSGASHPDALTNEAKFMDAIKSISPDEKDNGLSAENETNETSLSINTTGANISDADVPAINASTNSSATNTSAINATATNTSAINATAINATAINATAIAESSLNASEGNESSLSENGTASAQGVSSNDKSTFSGFWSMDANKKSSMGSGVKSHTSLSGNFDIDKTVKISE